MKNAIRYSIFPKDPAAHLFEVTVTVPAPAADGQRFMLPAWIPGSYMIREFARNIVRISAEAGGEPIALEKLDKHTWRAAPCDAALTVTCEIYAWDLSVRAAHLDQTHGFFNGPSVFLRAIGHEDFPHVVDIRRPAPPAGKGWRVATALPELRAKRYGFGTYVAADYDELIDHPVEMGTFELLTFDAHGVPHEVAITGRVPNLDDKRLMADLKKICEAQIGFFEPVTKRAPMPRYVFLAMVVGDGYGGLEHRSSTALLCSRNDLPAVGGGHSAEGYENFLGLCSHEYFHTWHVKCIKPAAFMPYELQGETYTRLLWLFEGFTSYYDDLFLVRSGVIDVSAYLRRIARTINGVLRGSGRSKQSLSDASFDAWIKFYRQDENAPNALANYYTQGSLVALALDLTIRARTKGRKSLDDGMRALWRRCTEGIGEREAEDMFEKASGLDLARFFEQYVHGTAELPLGELLAPFGIQVNDERKAGKPSLDVRAVRAGSDLRLAIVYEGGAAHRAGLSAGDLLVAVDGLRAPADPAGLDKLLARYAPGQNVAVHAFRRGELMAFEITLDPERAPQLALTVQEGQNSVASAREAWLGK